MTSGFLCPRIRASHTTKGCLTGISIIYGILEGLVVLIKGGGVEELRGFL